MARTAQRTDPALWERVKKQVMDGEKGGHTGEWSARKAQLAVAEYKKAGGNYDGGKDPHNHLSQWTHEEWGTRSGGESLKTGERYLPKHTRETLTDEEYARTTAKKRHDTARGRQFSPQPEDVKDKVSHTRLTEMPVAALRKRAAAHDIVGRSRMTKQQLIAALS